jgi:excisionase family DNA binding protein
METNNDLQLLTLKEAAAFIGVGCTENFLRLQIGEGQLKYVKVGKRFCVTREALNRWILTHQTTQK